MPALKVHFFYNKRSVKHCNLSIFVRVTVTDKHDNELYPDE